MVVLLLYFTEHGYWQFKIKLCYDFLHSHCCCFSNYDELSEKSKTQNDLLTVPIIRRGNLSRDGNRTPSLLSIPKPPPQPRTLEQQRDYTTILLRRNADPSPANTACTTAVNWFGSKVEFLGYEFPSQGKRGGTTITLSTVREKRSNIMESRLGKIYLRLKKRKESQSE
jgi:hypothetical protein